MSGRVWLLTPPTPQLDAEEASGMVLSLLRELYCGLFSEHRATASSELDEIATRHEVIL